jgi:hypothetical protein
MALMLALDLGAQILLIIHSCLVALMSLKQILPLEAFLLLIPGIILLLMNGVTNLEDKILLMVHPLLPHPMYQFCDAGASLTTSKTNVEAEDSWKTSSASF